MEFWFLSVARLIHHVRTAPLSAVALLSGEPPYSRVRPALVCTTKCWGPSAGDHSVVGKYPRILLNVSTSVLYSSTSGELLILMSLLPSRQKESSGPKTTPRMNPLSRTVCGQRVMAERPEMLNPLPTG